MSDPLSKQATASDVARAVMSGKAKASAVVEAALTRIETSEPTINAFTDVLAQRARRRAAEIDAGRHRGPLMGVPFAVKNLFDIEGLPTRAGSKINVENPAADLRGSHWLSCRPALEVITLPAGNKGLLGPGDCCSQIILQQAIVRGLAFQ